MGLRSSCSAYSRPPTHPPTHPGRLQKLVAAFVAHNQVQPATLRHIAALLWAVTSLK